VARSSHLWWSFVLPLKTRKRFARQFDFARVDHADTCPRRKVKIINLRGIEAHQVRTRRIHRQQIRSRDDHTAWYRIAEERTIAFESDNSVNDGTRARLMGFDPAQIDYLDFAAWAGIGVIDAGKIELAGESLARFQRKYESPPKMG